MKKCAVVILLIALEAGAQSRLQFIDIKKGDVIPSSKLSQVQQTVKGSIYDSKGFACSSAPGNSIMDDTDVMKIFMMGSVHSAIEGSSFKTGLPHIVFNSKRRDGALIQVNMVYASDFRTPVQFQRQDFQLMHSPFDPSKTEYSAEGDAWVCDIQN